MRISMKRLLAAWLALVLALGCASFAAAEDKSANVAVTGTIGSINPLLIDATEVEKYVMSLTWLPLVELNEELEFVPLLAESISTEDNQLFTIKLRDDAVWSDGEPVTSADVLFTLLLVTSPEAGEAYLNQYVIVGTDDETGHLPSGAQEIEGVRILDDKTLTVQTKWPTALYTFNNNFGRYLFVLPEHVLKDVPRDEILGSDWFNHPDVISGPYFVSEVDLNHYVRFTANESFFLGAPKIKYLNFNVTDSAQVLAGLKSGEIDLVQQTMGTIPMEDYEAVGDLPGVTAVSGSPITNQSIFINVENVPDIRIRQALLYGLDRETILQEMLYGNGELVDGFLCSASPYYTDIGLTPYDPEKAGALIAEAAADGADTTLTWYAWSDDQTFVNAVSYTAALFADLGLTIDVQTVNLDTLMDLAGRGEIDVMSVQYTFMPVDPYTDMSWLLSAEGWTHYHTDATDEALALTQTATSLQEIADAYAVVDRAMQEDPAMISAYIMSTLGAVNNRLVGAKPNVFGTFINVHEWDIQE